MSGRIPEFDGMALFAAIDAKRQAEGHSWQYTAAAIWDLSAELNARRNSHPISPATIKNIGTRGDTSCQHALFFLRWLGRSPESFLDAPSPYDAPLPVVGPDRRLRWKVHDMYAAMNEQRQHDDMTWAELALHLRCTTNQLIALKTARFATGMRLAMRITHWLERPAADFVRAAQW